MGKIVGNVNLGNDKPKTVVTEEKPKATPKATPKTTTKKK